MATDVSAITALRGPRAPRQPTTSSNSPTPATPANTASATGDQLDRVAVPSAAAVSTQKEIAIAPKQAGSVSSKSLISAP